MKILVVVWLIYAQQFEIVFLTASNVERCKNISPDPNIVCKLNDAKGNYHLRLDNIYKDEEKVEGTSKLGTKPDCNEDSLDFLLINELSKSIWDSGENTNVYEEMHPFMCESSEDSIQSGVGSILLKNGHFKTAIAHYTNLIETRKHQPCPLWYFGRAMVYDKLGLTEASYVASALSDYTSALHYSSGKATARVYEARAELYTSLGEHERAFEDCTSAIDISPSFNLYLRRGISLVFLEKYPAAYRDLQQSLRLYPHQTTAMHYLATCLFHMRRLNEAINTFEAVLVLKPRDADVMLGLAQAHTELGDFDKAFGYLNKASVLHPTNPYIHRRKAQLLYDRGNVAAAAVAFRKCVSLEPFNHDCRLMVAKSYANSGQFYPAIKELTKVTRGVAVRDNKDIHTYPATMYLREWCRYVHHRLDTALVLFSVEREVHEGFKDNWTRDVTCSLHNYTEQPGLQPHIKDLHFLPWEGQPRSIQKLLCFAFNQGRSSHAQGARFSGELLGNVRVHLATGLASLEIMQTLPHILKKQEKVGKIKTGTKPLQWKDVFDIAVKWIRFVDLDKPLFWVDTTSSRTNPFLHRFALIQYNQTRSKYEKYYSKFHHAILQQCDKDAPPYDDSVEPEENFGRLFLVQRNCKKPNDYIMVSNKIGSKKEGLKNQIDGFLLGLQMDKESKVNLVLEIDLNRFRVKRMHEELDFIWTRIADEYHKLSSGIDSNGPDHVINAMISLSYYFLNLMPLSHSSTVVSHATAVGLIAAVGRESVGQITPGKDLSLEALTSNEQEKFRSNLRSWLSFRKSSNVATELENVAQSFPDFRHMLTVMQYDLTTLCNVD